MSMLNQLLLHPKLLNGIQILIVDNDRDSRDLYSFILESYEASVTKTGCVKDALEILNTLSPALLICEVRFLGEDVQPLLQRVRDISLKSGKIIPILVTSTCSHFDSTQQWKLGSGQYLLKPIDSGRFAAQAWSLIRLSQLKTFRCDREHDCEAISIN